MSTNEIILVARKAKYNAQNGLFFAVSCRTRFRLHSAYDIGPRIFSFTAQSQEVEFRHGKQSSFIVAQKSNLEKPRLDWLNQKQG